MLNLRKIVQETLTQNADYVLSESFFYRTDDSLSNLIQSFKNLLLNLRYSIEERHRLEFFSGNIKNDIETYKDHLLLYYNKNSKKEFIKKFNELVDEIDSDLINELDIEDLIKKVTSVFKDEDSVDAAKIKLDKIFDSYAKKFDKKVKALFSTFQEKLEDNEFYEPLKNIKIATSQVTFEEFLKQRYLLQIELLKLEEWVRANDKKVLILFEGRDAAGKGSTIKMFTENMDPKNFRVETFGVPNDYEKKHWFKRYEEKIPKKGEIVFFDRSWYNRAYLEPVMEYCTKEQYEKFMKDVKTFEQDLADKNVTVIKLWFSVSKDTQKLRFELRKSNPLRYWKYSKNDAQTIERWDEFTKYVNKMLKQTNSKDCPWVIIDSNDDRQAKLLSIKKVLKKFPYDEKNPKVLKESKEEKTDKFIFLDIDGVLIPAESVSMINHADFDDNEKWNKKSINNLNELIKETGAKIVISSHYRKLKTMEEIKNKFKELGINASIVGEISKGNNMLRGEEIQKYVDDNNIKDFVVIDDLSHDFNNFFPEKYVKPKTNIGFDKENLKKALNILKEIDLRHLIKSVISEIEMSDEEKTRRANLDYMQSHVKEVSDFVTHEIPEYYLKEAGIETILDFLIVEDSSNFRIQHGMVTPGTITFKGTEPKRDNESEIDYILRANKIPYTWKEIKGRLVQYFIRRMQANVPRDHMFTTLEEVWNFLKVYEQKFLYNYMIPMSKMAEKRK